jgi:hypothetical protein
VHPSYLVTEEASAAWQLFRAYWGGGFAPGSLPFAGGYAEQPACIIASFDLLAAAEAALAPKKPKPRTEDV